MPAITPIAPRDVRPRALAATDPIAVVVASTFAIVSTFGVFARLGLGADQVAELLAAIMAIAASVRWWLEHRNAAAVIVSATNREAVAFADGLATPVPVRRDHEAPAGEGGTVAVPTDDTPVDDPARVDRQG